MPLSVLLPKGTLCVGGEVFPYHIQKTEVCLSPSEDIAKSTAGRLIAHAQSHKLAAEASFVPGRDKMGPVYTGAFVLAQLQTENAPPRQVVVFITMRGYVYLHPDTVQTAASEMKGFFQQLKITLETKEAKRSRKARASGIRVARGC